MMNKQFNQISKDEIINICGEYPDGFEAPNILSNPDFVFTNDVTIQQLNYLISMEIRFLLIHLQSVIIM